MEKNCDPTEIRTRDLLIRTRKDRISRTEVFLGRFRPSPDFWHLANTWPILAPENSALRHEIKWILVNWPRAFRICNQFQKILIRTRSTSRLKFLTGRLTRWSTTKPVGFMIFEIAVVESAYPTSFIAISAILRA